jgi:hypothetical protein
MAQQKWKFHSWSSSGMFHIAILCATLKHKKTGRQCTYNVLPRCFRVTIVAVDKQWVLYIPKMCLQPYLSCMQCACAILPSVACPTLPYFSTWSHKRHHFRKKKILNTKCLFWFCLQLLSEIFLILRKTERDMIKYLYWYACTVPLFLSDVNGTWIFLVTFPKKILHLCTEITNHPMYLFIYLFIYKVFGFCSVRELSG